MTFNNSILSGTTLAREAIGSEGFVSGSTGWIIERDGNAEFNDATFRGTILVTDESGNYIEITIAELSGAPVIDMKGDISIIEWLTDGGDLSFWEGRDTSIGGVPFRYWFDNGSSLNVFQYLNNWAAVDDIGGGFGIDNAILKKVIWTDNAYLDDWTYMGWQNISMLNGWAHDSGHLVPGAKILPHGSVELCGGATGGPGGTSTFGNLPSSGTVDLAENFTDFIPSDDVRIPVMSNVSGAVGSGEARLVIRGRNHVAAGRMEIFNVGAGASISLDGCTYPVDR